MAYKSAALAVGATYGRLTATSHTELRKRPDGRNRLYQTFNCVCGNSVICAPYTVTSGNTSSCGCIHSEQLSARMKTHGLSKTSAYRVALNRARRLSMKAESVGVVVEKITSADLQIRLEEYNNLCWICELTVEGTPWGWDHVHPLSKGGSHTLNNLKPACRDCNSRKSNTWPFTDSDKNRVANITRALRAIQDESLVTDGLEVSA